MHILGKVLLWLNVIGAAGACVLTAKLFDVRNSWTRKIDDLQQQVAQNEVLLTQQTAEFEQLTDDFHQTMIGWGRSWDGVTAGTSQQGLVTQGLGRNQGLMTSGDPANPGPSPIVHAFQTQPNGQSRYVGAFLAQQVQDTSAQLVPTWDARPEDFVGVQNGPNWRFRAEVPARYTAEYVKLRTARTVAERALADNTRYLQQQILQESQADVILKNRNEELRGNGQSPGLVVDLALAEEDRNVELLRLDQLRRQVKSSNDRIQSLVADVKRLEDQLDGP